MAEAVGLTTSIISLIQLTGKLTGLGYGYLGCVKRAPNDLRDLVDELNSLSRVLATMQNYVDKNPGSVAIQELGGINGPLQGCDLALKELQSKLEPRDGFKGFMDNLKWPLKESETTRFVSRIERQKSLFSLALSVDMNLAFMNFQKKAADQEQLQISEYSFSISRGVPRRLTHSISGKA